jgi:Dolichyl-phosphate-mannose-protein mannosyltransferase
MVWAAGHYTVFDDEAFSCQRYVLPMGDMVRGLWDGVEPDPPLYYVLENLSVHVVGVSPVGLRFLSIIMFLAGLVVMRAAATAWFDRPTGIATMVLCAIHPAHLFFGFAGRWYSTMFLAVAVLLYVTRRLVDADRPTGRWMMLLALSVAAVLYTNYFGVVVVGLIWLASIWRCSDKWRFLVAGVLAAIFFTPWIPPFWRQMTAFPKFSGSAGSMLATAARTTMALLAGDLASPRAWWVWGPMVIFVISTAGILVLHLRRFLLITLVVAGCFIAGVISRTMIDKYIMTFSGIVCMWLALLLTEKMGESRSASERFRISAMAALTLAWLGCGYNLVTERNWSSLRWLDPFETAVAAARRTGVPSQNWVVTHPSGRYYAARAFTSTMPGNWLNNWIGLAIPGRMKCDDFLRTPGQMHSDIDTRSVPEVIAIEAASYSDSPDWDDLRRVLDEYFEMVSEAKYLEDSDAEWKDRLDPEYRHPRWRIIVRHWRLKHSDQSAS